MAMSPATAASLSVPKNAAQVLRRRSFLGMFTFKTFALSSSIFRQFLALADRWQELRRPLRSESSSESLQRRIEFEVCLGFAFWTSCIEETSDSPDAAFYLIFIAGSGNQVHLKNSLQIPEF